MADQILLRSVIFGLFLISVSQSFGFKKDIFKREVLGRVKRQTIQLYDEEKTFFDQNKKQTGGRSVQNAEILIQNQGAPVPPQELRVRGKGRMNANEGRVEVFDKTKNMWMSVCDDYWSMKHSNVACRNLGFKKGAREANRNDRYGVSEINATRENTRNGIRCVGNEQKLSECYFNPQGYCTGKSAGVSCIYNEGCSWGWTSFKGACFRVQEQPLPYKEAQKYCQELGAKLTYVLTVEENNFISNMLATQFKSVKQAWTGGYYAEVTLDSGKKETKWNWYQTIHNVDSWNLNKLWFPGFRNSEAITKRPNNDPREESCLALSTLFADSYGTKTYNVDYFWWDNLSCQKALPFVCQKTIQRGRSDCYNGNGYDYRGYISRTTQGSVCAKWTDPYATVNPTSNPNTGLGDHNYCRNPDNDMMPWCWVNPQAGVYGYCAVSRCTEVTQAPSTKPPVAVGPPGFGNGGCSSSEFFCPSMTTYRRECRPKSEVCDKTANCLQKEDENKEFCRKYLCQDSEYFCEVDTFCISKSFVCDGRNHCSDGADEKNCSQINSERILKENYDAIPDKSLNDGQILSYYQISVIQCMQYCRTLYPAYPCLSFNFFPPHGERYYSECQLTTTTKYLSPDKLQPSTSPVVHYSPKQNCTGKFQCKNGICIDLVNKCNQKNDCGDSSDEQDCPTVEKSPFEIRLTGSKNQYEGIVEIRYNGEWGYICDDGFDKNDAAVVCRMLGFESAEEAVLISTNKFGKIRSPNILVSELKCEGNEFSIEKCPHDPWKKHNCRPDELAGVVCKVDRACTSNEFRCKTDKRCIPISKVCDNVDDCSDKSDEPAGKCKLEVKLVNGPDDKSGRVEVSKGYTQGTICDDGFNNGAATVVCRMLGISGRAEAVRGGIYGQGTGMIALENLQCSGTETTLEECKGFKLGGKVCSHSEDVGVKCGLADSTPAPVTTKPPTTARSCGSRPITQARQRVVGGFQAIYGAFPWQVGIRRKIYDYDSHHCGGTILSEQWIISAAHCFELPKNNYLMRTGDWNNENSDTYEQQFEVEELILHPNYNPSTYDFDLALIKIAPSNGRYIQFNNFVQPVCLPKPTDEPDPRTKCYVSGWGNTLQEYPAQLLAAEVPLIKAEDCNEMYKGAISERMQCAGYRGGGIDTCQGDSGGPLICRVQGVYTIFGATSWGNGCAEPQSPGVYTQIRKFLDYIKQITGVNY